MKLQNLLVIATMITGFAAEAATNYSKCAEFLKPNNPYGGDPKMWSRFTPFTLKEDGTIKPFDDVSSYKKDPSGLKETIVYESPRWEPDSNGRMKETSRDVTVTINRTPDGNISEIVYDEGIGESEIEKIVKANRAYYEQSTPESVKKLNQDYAKSSGQGNFELPFFSLKNTTVRFDVKNDECIPSVGQANYLVEPKKDGAVISSTQFHVNLCRDLKEFLDKNPEASSCFKTDLNKKVEKIFDKYFDRRNLFKNIGYGLGGVGMGYGMYNNFSPYSGSVEEKIMRTPETGISGSQYAAAVEKNQRKFSTSPVLTAQGLYEDCMDQDLKFVVEDNDLWSKKAPAPTFNSNSDATRR